MPELRSFLFSGESDRLDRFLTRKLAPLSRTRVQKLITGGGVTVNTQNVITARHLLSARDSIRVSLPDFSSLPAADKSVTILYEDKVLIVVDKPAGMVVHPAGPHQTNTLVQRLWPKLSPNWSDTIKRASSSESVRPGVVHRLDRETSGVMLIAKTPAAAENLSHQFAGRTVKKIYLAFVNGIPATQEGHIRSMVGRSRSHPYRMSVADQGRWSETEFRVMKQFSKFGEKGAALLEVHPLTGRTHQIRVQLASLGHPLVGDRLYGAPKTDAADRTMLHSFSLEITHPVTNKRMQWHSRVPDDFLKISGKIDKLKTFFLSAAKSQKTLPSHVTTQK